jgi:hypothetical protein
VVFLPQALRGGCPSRLQRPETMAATCQMPQHSAAELSTSSGPLCWCYSPGAGLGPGTLDPMATSVTALRPVVLKAWQLPGTPPATRPCTFSSMAFHCLLSFFSLGSPPSLTYPRPPLSLVVSATSVAHYFCPGHSLELSAGPLITPAFVAAAASATALLLLLPPSQLVREKSFIGP